MNHSIQWPKTGDVLGDFILNSEIEITTARARFLAIHEPTEQKALLVCGTSELDLKLFMKRLANLALCQFRGAPKMIDGSLGDDFCWIAHEYLECESLPAAVQRKLISQGWGRGCNTFGLLERCLYVWGVSGAFVAMNGRCPMLRIILAGEDQDRGNIVVKVNEFKIHPFVIGSSDWGFGLSGKF